MRGTNDAARFEMFVTAVVGFPPTARDGKTAMAVFAESYALLDDLTGPKSGPPYPRAMAWKGYAIALSVYEAWAIPKGFAEEPMTPAERLERAEALANEAIAIDGTDHDLYWARADIRLVRNNHDGAKQDFAAALYYNGDERHPGLFADAGAAMIQTGDLDTAETYFRKAARRPDWHQWMRGTLEFVKAGRLEGDSEAALNAALDELFNTHKKLGEDRYQHEIQLALATVHWRLWEEQSGKAAAMEPSADRDAMEQKAAQNLALARGEIGAFRAVFGHWSVDQACDSLLFKLPGDWSYWRDTIKELWKL